MRMKTKINSLPAVAVFARNHRAYLEDVTARNKKQPEAFTVFRAASLKLASTTTGTSAQSANLSLKKHMGQLGKITSTFII